jgi:hypothetical protein
MTNKELQEELKKHPDDSLILKASDYGDFPVASISFSEDLPRNAMHFNMQNPRRFHYVTLE